LTNQDLEQRQKLVLVGLKKTAEHQLKSNWDLNNFYLYSSVHPVSGKHFKLLMPNLDTSCMNVYLKELSQEIKEDFILIMDVGLAGTNLGI